MNTSEIMVSVKIDSESVMQEVATLVALGVTDYDELISKIDLKRYITLERVEDD